MEQFVLKMWIHTLALAFLVIQEQIVKHVKYFFLYFLIIKINIEIDNPCYNNPCLNGATCQTSVSSYICICPQFYSGTNCQTCKIIIDNQKINILKKILFQLRYKSLL